MKYQFDLTAADYSVVSTREYGWVSVFKYNSPHSLAAALASWIFARHWIEASSLAALTTSAFTFISAMALLSSAWRQRFLSNVRNHYNDPDRSAILGVHTLELTEDGLNSTGPLHKTFRDWRSVTKVVMTSTHAFIHTAFGVIYVLPLRAVSDLPALEAFLIRKSVCKLAA